MSKKMPILNNAYIYNFYYLFVTIIIVNYFF